MLRERGQTSTTSCNIQNVARKIWPFSNLIQHVATHRNISQQGGQTYATCCAQQCCKMLRWNVASVWPGLYSAQDIEAIIECSRSPSELETQLPPRLGSQITKKIDEEKTPKWCLPVENILMTTVLTKLWTSIVLGGKDHVSTLYDQLHPGNVSGKTFFKNRVEGKW